jgi:hypothetical protein
MNACTCVFFPTIEQTVILMKFPAVNNILAAILAPFNQESLNFIW